MKPNWNKPSLILPKFDVDRADMGKSDLAKNGKGAGEWQRRSSIVIFGYGQLKESSEAKVLTILPTKKK